MLSKVLIDCLSSSDKARTLFCTQFGTLLGVAQANLGLNRTKTTKKASKIQKIQQTLMKPEKQWKMMMCYLKLKLKLGLRWRSNIGSKVLNWWHGSSRQKECLKPDLIGWNGHDPNPTMTKKPLVLQPNCKERNWGLATLTFVKYTPLFPSKEIESMLNIL